MNRHAEHIADRSRMSGATRSADWLRSPVALLSRGKD